MSRALFFRDLIISSSCSCPPPHVPADIYLFFTPTPQVISSAEKTPLLEKVGYTPDYVGLLQHVMRMNPEKGAEFATQLANDESGPLVDVDSRAGRRYFHVAEHDSTCHFVLIRCSEGEQAGRGHLPYFD